MSQDSSGDGATVLDLRSPTRRRARLDLGDLLAPPVDHTRELGRPTSASPRALAVGERVADFTVEAELALGGMARVLLARDDAGERVALKTPRPDVPGIAGLFRREMAVMARLDHPQLARARAVGTAGGVDFIALEWIDGPTLRELLTSPAPLPLSALLEIARDVARGLAHVHAVVGDDGRPLGLVHRDVCAENVLVAREGRAVLVDFGIAWLLEREDPTRLGELRGRPASMAPEQAAGGPVDARADLYALGRLLAEAAEGRDAPAELRVLIARLCAESPAHRPTSAAEVADALEHLAAHTAGPTIAQLLAPRDGGFAASMSGDVALTVTDRAPPDASITRSLAAGATAVDATIARATSAATAPADPAADPPAVSWPVMIALLLAGAALLGAALVLTGVV